jgi:hypothetical protein
MLRIRTPQQGMLQYSLTRQPERFIEMHKTLTCVNVLGNMIKPQYNRANYIVVHLYKYTMIFQYHEFQTKFSESQSAASEVTKNRDTDKRGRGIMSVPFHIGREEYKTKYERHLLQ